MSFVLDIDLWLVFLKRVFWIVVGDNIVWCELMKIKKRIDS